MTEKDKPRQVRTIIEKCGNVDSSKEVMMEFVRKQMAKISEWEIFKSIHHDFIAYINEDLFYEKKLQHDTATIADNGLVMLKIVKVTETEFGYVEYDSHNRGVVYHSKKYADVGIPILEGNVIIKFEEKEAWDVEKTYLSH